MTTFLCGVKLSFGEVDCVVLEGRLGGAAGRGGRDVYLSVCSEAHATRFTSRSPQDAAPTHMDT